MPARSLRSAWVVCVWRWRRRLPWRARLWPLALRCRAWAREELLNGVGNLLGMLMTFLGGAWMPLSLMGSAVQTVAHFVPTYWVNDAISKALASDLTSTVLGDIACDLGVTALFAVAIAAAGLALARTKSHA